MGQSVRVRSTTREVEMLVLVVGTFCSDGMVSGLYGKIHLEILEVDLDMS